MNTAARTRTYFISDLHLGAKYISDPKAHERAIVDFLRTIAPTAKRLYLLGDILDYWFEYRTVVPRGFTRFFGALAELADQGTEVVWFTGNHDIWLFDYLRNEIGFELVDPADGYILRNIDGTLFCLAHGDGIGHRTVGFNIIRSIFRNRILQKLFSGIHPRWTVAFAHAWSKHSRKGSNIPTSLNPKVRAGYEVFSRNTLNANPDLRYIVLGHQHIPIDEPISENCRLIILGDWLSRHTYAVFDGSNLTLNEFFKS